MGDIKLLNPDKPEIPKTKFQIPNKSQAPNTNDPNAECADQENFLGFWMLEFGIYLEFGFLGFGILKSCQKTAKFDSTGTKNQQKPLPTQKKVWAGRMQEPTSPLMDAFSRSIDTDRLMWREDLQVQRAWAEELAAIGVYSEEELHQVQRALDAIAAEFEQDTFRFVPADEDIHVAIERRLTELAGDAGARIHTGRSRNDQVATGARLYLRRRLGEWTTELIALQEALVQRAAEHRQAVLPGYTHLQQAQPISLAHFLLAIFHGIDRTLQRLADFYPRLQVLPLGAGALAGSAFPIDRRRLAQKLGFARASANSIDATGDRDFLAETLFIIAAYFTHLSRVCAEWQVWNSQEFGFIEFADAFATGSSMMPQKKNPDAMELIRGKAAAAIAACQQILILQKGLPLTYNRDLQEDKPVVFRQLDEVIMATAVFREALATAAFNTERMRQALQPLLYATDVADYLVERGVPFRHAHEIVAALVRQAIAAGTPLEKLPLETYRQQSAHFDESVYALFKPEHSLARRNVEGGTGPKAVAAQLRAAQRTLTRYRKHPFFQ